MTTEINYFPKFKNVIEFTEWLLKQEDLEKKITLRTVYKTDKITIQPPKDNTGRYIGGVLLDSQITKEMRDTGVYYPTPESKRVIEEGVVFDLQNPIDDRDVKDWKWIQYSRYIAVDEETARSMDNIYFFIEMPEAKASASIEKIVKKKRAMDLVQELPQSRYADVCSMLGNTGSSRLSDTQLLSFLYTMADKPDGAAKIINVLEDPDYQIQLLFNSAKRKGIIRYVNKVFIYGDIELGFTEQQAVSFLKNKTRNGNIINSIIAETNGITLEPEETEKQVEEAIEKTTVKKPTTRRKTTK